MLLDDHGRFDNGMDASGSRSAERVSQAHRPAVRHSNGSDKKGEEEIWLWALGGAVVLGIAGVGYVAFDNMNKQRMAQQQAMAAAQQNSVQQQREKEMHDAQPQPQAQQPVSEPAVNTGDYYTDANAAAAQSTVAVDVAVAPEPEPVKELEEEDPDSIISTYAPRF